MRSFILKGLLPWILLFAFLDGTLVALKMAVFASLACLLIFNFRSLIKRNIFDWGTLMYLVFLLIVGFADQNAMIIQYSLPISYLVLALLCFFTLIIRKPFALVYARTQIEPMYWNNPTLIKVCYKVTSVWAVTFLFIGLLVSLFYYGFGSKLWMVEILPTACLILAIGFTIFFPDVYRNSQMKRGGVIAIPGISDIKQITLGNIQLSYRTIGQGPLIILLPDARMTMHYWDPELLKKLSQDFQLLIVDYPGVGCSTYQNMPYTAEKIAMCVERMIDKLDLKPVALLGFSLGGMIAQTFIMHYPDKVKSLILINSEIAGEQNQSAEKNILDQFYDLSGSENVRDDRIMSLLFPKKIVERVAPKIEKIISAASLDQPILDAMIQKQQELAEQWRQDKVVDQTVPALIILGEEDKIVLPQNSRLLHKMIKGSEMVEYKDASHGVIYQYPLDIADHIKLFVTKVIS